MMSEDYEAIEKAERTAYDLVRAIHAIVMLHTGSAVWRSIEDQAQRVADKLDEEKQRIDAAIADSLEHTQP